MTRAELTNKMAILLGGRAAEQVVFGETSTGAADDLVRATDIARAMVLKYGMSDALGNVAYDREQSTFLQPNIAMPQNRNYSEETAHKIDIAVRSLVDQALACAVSILQMNRALLDQTAEKLLKDETLNQPDILILKQAIIPNTQ